MIHNGYNEEFTRAQDDKNYYIISDYYMGGDVQAELVGMPKVVPGGFWWVPKSWATGFKCRFSARQRTPARLLLSGKGVLVK